MEYGDNIFRDGLHNVMTNIFNSIENVFRWFDSEPKIVKSVTSDQDGDGRHYLGLSIDLISPRVNRELICNSLNTMLEGPYQVTMVGEIIHIDYVQDINDFKQYLRSLED